MICEFNIRKGSKEDIPKLYLFEQKYIKEIEPENLELWNKSKNNILKVFRDNISRTYVCCCGKDIVAHAYWSPHDGKPCVYSVFVEKQYRKNNIASLLMEKIENQVKGKGYDAIELSTLTSNPAQYLFEKLGYRKTETVNGWICYTKSI